MIGIRVINCRGESFCISSSYGPPAHIFPPSQVSVQWGLMKRFFSSFCVDYFIATLSDFDLQILCHHFTTRGQFNRQWLAGALLNGELKVYPETPLSDLHSGHNQSASSFINHTGKKPCTQPKERRSFVTIRSDLKLTLRQIVEQERIEAQQIERQYQQKNTFGKNLAHLKRFGNGLYSSGASFLTWMKDVNDVLSLNQRLLRIIKAAMAAEQESSGRRYQTFKQTLAESEKKELVEALGFDPATLSVEKLKQVYELANLIYDDHLTRIILTQFVKDYADVQHSLEWSEFSGGAAFEVILTALLALATGGAGAIASLGAQARKISQLKKLGALLSELAEQLKDLPKGKPVSLRQLKEAEEGKAQKAQKPAEKPAPKPSPEPDKEKVDSSAEDGSGTMRKEEVVPDKLDDIFRKIPESDYNAIKGRSVHNVDSDTLVLGKYRPTISNGIEDWSIPGPDSYVAIARTEKATYFDLGSEWGSVTSKYNLSDDEMFKAFNIPVLDDAVSAGKQIKFTHDPRTNGGFLQQEWEYLQNTYSYTRLKEIDGVWYAK